MRKVFVLIAAVALAACGEHTPETPAHADADTVLGPERSSMSASSSGYQPNAGVPTGCANDALLCANFDGGSQLPKGWRPRMRAPLPVPPARQIGVHQPSR